MPTHKTLIMCTAAATLLCCAAGALAKDVENEATHKVMVALKTADFELQETDVSDLAIGESRTIVTDSGKAIDLLRTDSGVEVYVDGELLDLGGHDSAPHERVHKRVEVKCTAEDECEKQIWVEAGEPGSDAGQTLERTIEIHCENADQCEHKMIFVGEDGEETVDLDALEGDAEVILLREDAAVHEPGEERVIVIKRKSDQP